VTGTDNWLLTAYEKKEKPVSASSSDIETEPEGKRNGTATPQNGAISAANIAENQQPAKQNDENLTENAQPGGERALEREWNGYKSGLKFSPVTGTCLLSHFLTPSNSRGLEKRQDSMLSQCRHQDGLNQQMQKDL